MQTGPHKIWDGRYSQDEFVYGKEPNAFFAQNLHHILKGKVLFSAEGEGRNAVYAAENGYDAFAFDISSEGKKKALQLANAKDVSIEYSISDALNFPIVPCEYEGLVVVFNHFPKSQQPVIFSHLLKGVKPGGKVLFQCFSEGHLPYREKSNVGGPPELDLLYNIQQVKQFFEGFKTLQLEEHEVILSEGQYHDGMGLVISGIFEK
jgi:SAM-dependent methyltransferase